MFLVLDAVIGLSFYGPMRLDGPSATSRGDRLPERFLEAPNVSARAAAAEIRNRPGLCSVSEPVRAMPVPNGLVVVGGDDDLEIELGQPPGPGAEDADRFDVAARSSL